MTPCDRRQYCCFYASEVRMSPEVLMTHRGGQRPAQVAVHGCACTAGGHDGTVPSPKKGL